MKKQKAYKIVLEDLLKDRIFNGVVETKEDTIMMPGIMATISIIADEAYGDEDYSDMLIDIMWKNMERSMERMAHGKRI